MTDTEIVNFIEEKVGTVQMWLDNGRVRASWRPGHGQTFREFVDSITPEGGDDGEPGAPRSPASFT